MGENQRFFSQLLNNLQTLPVYSLKLYSRQTTRWGGGGGGGGGGGRESAVKQRGRGEEESAIW